MKTAAHHEDEQGQRDGEHHVDVGEPLDALGDSGHGGEDEGGGEDGDDAHQDCVAGVAQAGDELEPRLDLQRAEPERRGRAEQGGEDGEHVDRLAAEAVGVVAQDRLEGRADQLQAPLAVDAVRHRQADDGVDRPRVQRPVEHRRRHRVLRGLGVPGLAGARRRRDEVGDRLADAVEHQPDAHARAEHHGDPRDRPELRLLVVAAERDVAELAEREPDHEDHERARGQHEEPAGLLHGPRQTGRGGVGEAAGADEAPREERQADDCGDPEHDLVHALLARHSGGDRGVEGGVGVLGQVGCGQVAWVLDSCGHHSNPAARQPTCKPGVRLLARIERRLTARRRHLAFRRRRRSGPRRC
jgi:hypothetical protein